MKKEESQLLSLLPKKSEEKQVYVQGYVPESLHAQVTKNMEKDGIKWADLLTASLTVYVNAKRKLRKR